MDIKQQILIAGIFMMSFLLWSKWERFSEDKSVPTEQVQLSATGEQILVDNSIPAPVPEGIQEDLPSAPTAGASIENINTQEGVSQDQKAAVKYITIETDLIVAKINTQGGGIESLELKREADKAETPDVKFALLKNTAAEIFISQSGLIGNNGSYPNHKTLYFSEKDSYVMSEDDGEIKIPLRWTSSEGISFTKTFTFKRDSYLVDVKFDVNNSLSTAWKGYFYAQFKRSQPADLQKGSLIQLPSFMGGVQYTPEDKYSKVSFKDISKEQVDLKTDSGWIGMLQHYFVGVWLSEASAGKNYKFYSRYLDDPVNPKYIMGYQQQTPLSLNPGQSGSIHARAFIGPKEQSRLKLIEENQKVEGLALTVDYGWLTVIADPLFWILDKIHDVVKNWGWSIILLTILIKLIFFPLSAASYRSMARMKKVQPRMQTLKERFGDDRAGLQKEMMKLYKEEKVNPAGGCLPILIQVPVFIALYYVLLESVEMRHAPFALWLQDLSSKDPYFILPILMGASMMLQFRLNPTPMEPMQQRIMMIMPIVMTFLFVTFPSGLVLYWVVNNILSIAQQWTINRTIGKEK
jgi:YidC/Oxa1 family membrane protein insertase